MRISNTPSPTGFASPKLSVSDKRWILTRTRARAAASLSRLSHFANSSVCRISIMNRLYTIVYILSILEETGQFKSTVANCHSGVIVLLSSTRLDVKKATGRCTHLELTLYSGFRIFPVQAFIPLCQIYS